MHKIALAGEAFSRNIGDQAIHACLAYILRQQDANLEILSLDISGRKEGVPSGGQNMFPILRAIPGSGSYHSLANIAFNRLQKERQQVYLWKPVIEKIDGLVIGGGQLLMDNNLDFPLKLSNLAGLAADKGIPYHISSCGVGKSWSQTADRLFQPVLTNAKTISLRDELSRQRLGVFMPKIKPWATFDPAIMAAEVYPIQPVSQKTNRVGLGVMSCPDVNFHLSGKEKFSKLSWLELWLELLSGLAGKNMQIELFSTGSIQDDRFAHDLVLKAIQRGWGSVSLAHYPASVTDLISTLQSYSLVIATRLHASILANAFGITSLGLVWDEKVKSYYQDTGQAELCFNLVGLQTSQLILASQELYGRPLPENLLNDLKNRARKNAQLI